MKFEDGKRSEYLPNLVQGGYMIQLIDADSISVFTASLRFIIFNLNGVEYLSADSADARR